MPETVVNIARHLPLMAGSRPSSPAIKIPRGRTRRGDIDYLTLSFAELEAEAAAWQARLTSAGVQRGDRTLVMVRPGLPLIASGGVLSHAPRMEQTAMMLLDSFEPEGFTELAEDSIFMMPHLGVLAPRPGVSRMPPAAPAAIQGRYRPGRNWRNRKSAHWHRR